MQYKIFDAHLHTYGTFLAKDDDLLSYLDRHNVEKAIITTVNRAASSKIYTNDDNGNGEDVSNENRVKKAFENLRKMMPKDQLDHNDVINISNLDIERFFKFFWFNPKIDRDEEERNYRILENHFKRGFCGVKIHSGIHLIKIPRDIMTLASFMQEYNKNFPLYIHFTPKFSAFGGISSKDLAKLAQSFPDLNIILGHAGLAMEFAIDFGLSLKQYKNIYFETSCSIPYAILSLVKTIGHKRLLFGSDAPVTNPIQLEIEKIMCLPIKSDQKQDIFYYNTNNLLLN
ncbi:MAG: amidohydrolase family protein [Candidatus Lokiarchaeota archaeon]|nr:amidohydrolase family protein [Candidatus Lokiarchaeota archaeon]